MEAADVNPEDQEALLSTLETKRRKVAVNNHNALIWGVVFVLVMLALVLGLYYG